MDAPRLTVRRARELRRKMSLPEGMLWRAIRSGGLQGLKFRRQHPFGRYILDFYCDEAKLAVEIDGYGHVMGDQPARDDRRDAWVEAEGVETLRIAALDVLKDLDTVLQQIAATAHRRKGARPSACELRA